MREPVIELATWFVVPFECGTPYPLGHWGTCQTWAADVEHTRDHTHHIRPRFRKDADRSATGLAFTSCSVCFFDSLSLVYSARRLSTRAFVKVIDLLYAAGESVRKKASPYTINEYSRFVKDLEKRHPALSSSTAPVRNFKFIASAKHKVIAPCLSGTSSAPAMVSVNISSKTLVERNARQQKSGTAHNLRFKTASAI